MREVEITYTNVKIDEVIVELARYVENGYHIVSWSSSLCKYGEDEYTIRLVKH